MTIAAGSLLALGIIQFFGDFIILVMATFTFLVLRLYMPVMQGFIHADRLPDGNKIRFVLMALTANHRPAFLPGISRFFVTGNTVQMVSIHYLLFGGVLEPHIFGNQAIILNQMTGAAVLVFFCQRFCVLLVKKCHRRPFQLAKGLHGIDANNVCPFLSRRFRWSLGSVNSGTGQADCNRKGDKYDSSPAEPYSTFSHFPNPH